LSSSLFVHATVAGFWSEWHKPQHWSWSGKWNHIVKARLILIWSDNSSGCASIEFGWSMTQLIERWWSGAHNVNELGCVILSRASGT
jgi:hypothetical protein